MAPLDTDAPTNGAAHPSHHYSLPFPKGRFTCVDEEGQLILEGDLLEAQLGIESLYDESQKGTESLGVIQAWVKERYGVDITPTQAWTLSWSVQAAFLDFKKKLEEELMRSSG